MSVRCLLVCLLGVSVTGCDQESPARKEPADVVMTAPAGVDNGFLGIQIVDPEATPLVIEGFVPGSSAESSGLQPGDSILRVHRRWDPTGDQLMEAVQVFRPGDVVGVRVGRGDDELEYQVRLLSYSEVQEAMEAAAH